MFLHFDCVDDVLNVRVHTLLRLSLRLNDRCLKDLPNEKNSRRPKGLLRGTVLNPVLGGSLEELCGSPTSCGTRMSTVCSTVRSWIPSSDTVFGNFTNCSTISGTGTSMQVSACRLGHFEDLLDNLWHLFPRLPMRWDTALRYHVGWFVHIFLCCGLEPTRVRWKDDQVCARSLCQDGED